MLLLASCGPGEEPPPPDVVVFLVDTLRADWTQVGGFALPTTPNLEALARESVVFEEAHAPCPWTLPSVVSIFTGRHLAEHGVVKEGVKLAGSVPTLAERLRTIGYDTTSLYRNPYAGPMSGLDRGFDRCERSRRNTGGEDLDAFFDRAIERPYFLYIHNAEPHDPQVARRIYREFFALPDEEFLAEYDELVRSYRFLTRVDYASNRPLGTTENSRRQRIKMDRLNELRSRIHDLYSGSVLDADDRLGSVIAKIKERGRWDDTLFIFLSDHGEEMADHGGWQHDQSLYQELVHVPLVVHFPRGKYAGRRVRTPISLVDVLPTVLELTGAQYAPDEITGRSLVGVIEAVGHPTAPEPRLLSIRHNQRKYYRPYKGDRGDLNVALRKGSWKAIYNIELDTLELYDLEHDPGEQTDLSLERPELARELRAFASSRYARLRERAVRPERGQDAPQGAREALEQLGYVSSQEEDQK